VIAGVALGESNAEIGARLGIALSTVGNRLHQAAELIGGSSRHGLVAQACSWGQLRYLPRQTAGRVVVPPDLMPVLRCYAAGMTYAQAARKLGTNRHAVETATRKLRAVLGARDRAHAVLIAWQLRILPEVTR
jgi:DNA-binding CsgD family transcriptional regulator